MREHALKFASKRNDEAIQWDELFEGQGVPKSYQEFLSLHDPRVVPTGKLHLNSDGFDLVLNDMVEVSIAKSFASSGFARAIRGQTYAIPFVKPWAKKSSPYYPDFIIYSHDGRICFLEVKSIMGMCQDETIAKYTYMSDFCKKRGYVYAMIDVDRIPFDLYLWPDSNPKAKEFFDKTIASCGGFNEHHLNQFLMHVPPKHRNEARRAFASLILLDPYIENRYCHDDPRLVNAVKNTESLPYKKFNGI
ncbi:MAG: hypothetical protein K6F32_04205 [Bacilli bacterium]|nr:hypothetical protein [Bacilli bacterium]